MISGCTVGVQRCKQGVLLNRSALAERGEGRRRCSLWLGFCSCLLILQKKPPRENDHKQISTSSSGSLSPNATVHSSKHEWKIIASEKTSSEYQRKWGGCLRDALCTWLPSSLQGFHVCEGVCSCR